MAAASVILTLTSTIWTKKLFGRGSENTHTSPPSLQQQLRTIIEGDKAQRKTVINESNITEVLTMLQHLDLPIDVRRNCNKTVVEYLSEEKRGLEEALIWLRKNIEQSTCKQILDDVDSSSICTETLVGWFKAQVHHITSSCARHSG